MLGFRKLFVVALGFVVAGISGCVEGETELVLKPDGQGSVRNVVRLGDLASALMRMGELESGRPGSGADVGLCEMLEKVA